MGKTVSRQKSRGFGFVQVVHENIFAALSSAESEIKLLLLFEVPLRRGCLSSCEGPWDCEYKGMMMSICPSLWFVRCATNRRAEYSSPKLLHS